LKAESERQIQQATIVVEGERYLLQVEVGYGVVVDMLHAARCIVTFVKV